MKKEILKVIKYPNFEVRSEQLFYTSMKPFIIDVAYTFDGKYIGDPDQAKYLASKYGIDMFEYRKKDSKITSIGFASKTQTWYGWSHRAIYGYTIGTNVNGKIIKTLEEAKQAAKDFAESVS